MLSMKAVASMVRFKALMILFNVMLQLLCMVLQIRDLSERAIMPDLVFGRLMVTTKELWKNQLSTLIDSRVSL